MAYVDELLATDESIVLKAHRHVLYLIARIGLYVAAALALWTIAGVALWLLDTAGTIIAGLLVLASLYFVVIAVYRFLAWSREIYIITNYRIIQVEGIIQKRTMDTALEKVNDVLMTQPMLGRMFGFGNIKIISGSDSGINDLTAIADPFQFKRTLVETKMRLSGVDDIRRFAEPAQAAPQTDALESARLLAALVDLRDSGVISADEFEQRKRQLLQQA
jgi:uncharacterized membrane protein YdbT with pleckstrin-like domain